MKICFAVLALGLGGCGVATITDRYGNQYGGWYGPGSNYTWQLDLCERQVEGQHLPAGADKLAMRCCMYAHGVPIGDPRDCHA